LKKNNWIKKK